MLSSVPLAQKLESLFWNNADTESNAFCIPVRVADIFPGVYARRNTPKVVSSWGRCDVYASLIEIWSTFEPNLSQHSSFQHASCWLVYSRRSSHSRWHLVHFSSRNNSVLVLACVSRPMWLDNSSLGTWSLFCSSARDKGSSIGPLYSVSPLYDHPRSAGLISFP